jgi:AAA15 family ATPase/GTPase
MLIEFSVGNYRSFQEPRTLSMVAANITSQPNELDEHNTFPAKDDLTLLTSAAIYGANASGKSNIIKALEFMRRFVLSSSKNTQIAEPIAVEPFLLSLETRAQPSYFELVFLDDGIQYRYGFEVNSERIVSEWLYRLGSLREQTLFTRDHDTIKVNSRNFREGRGLEMRTRPNALFLSVVAQFNGAISTQVLQWFHNLTINGGVHDIGELFVAFQLFEDSPYRHKIEQLIRRLDVGIDALAFERRPVSIPQDLPMELGQPLKAMLDTLSNGSPAERAAIKTQHAVFDEQGRTTTNIMFDLEEHESAGTQRLFALALPLVRALNEGSVLVIDELDARMHPNLALELIRLFHSRETNPRHAQLIFTTHNTNLLSAHLFRRDQIWFVEKSRHGASDLYSLVEYRVDGKLIRNDASFEKDYIAGRYGAIPFVGDLSDVSGVEVEQTTVTT